MYKSNIVFGPRILYIKDQYFLPLYGSTSRRNLSLGWNAPLLLTGKEPWPCTDGNLRIDVCDRIIQIRFLTPSWLLKILLWWWVGFCTTICVLVEIFLIGYNLLLLCYLQNKILGLYLCFKISLTFRFARKMPVLKLFFIVSWN